MRSTLNRGLPIAAALLAGATLLTGCSTLGLDGPTPDGRKPAPIPDVSRPTLFEIRRGPQQQAVAAVWTPDGMSGQVVFDMTAWPIQPDDVWHDTSLESPPAGDLCTQYMPQLGGPEAMWAEWVGHPNDAQNPMPCGAPAE